MSKNIYDALEYCLQAMEDGASLDAVLSRYPELAAELRPILEGAQRARELGVPEPSAEAIRRGRQRLLQRAAQLRSARSTQRQRFLPLVQRVGFALALATVFLLSGTGLVQASSSTLPGDELYPVKRTWEDVRLLFVFTPQHRDALEGEYEQERLDEVSQLLQKGRVVSISFSGLITSQANGEIVVSGVPVAITNQTRFSGAQSVVGASVIVIGQTDAQGHVTALHVQVLPPGSVVPLGEPAATEAPGAPSTGSGSEDQEDDSKRAFHIKGIIQSMQGNMLVIDGRVVYLSAPPQVALGVGDQVEAEGYYGSDGRFILTSIEAQDSGSNGAEIQQGQDSGGDQTEQSGGDHQENKSDSGSDSEPEDGGSGGDN